MRNKGLIKLFAILLAIICIYQLSFTFIARRVENSAERYAAGDSAKAQFYLDSVLNQQAVSWIPGITYQEARNNEMNLGLDLKGGINVILQVSVKDILKSLSGNSQNPVFLAALEQASHAQKNSQEDFLDLFFERFEVLRIEEKSELSLSSPAVFGTKDLSGQVNPGDPDESVKAVIRRKVDAAVDDAFTVLHARIDKFGVAQPNIQRIGTSGRILVELPGVKNAERVKKLLQSTAQLQFWDAYNLGQIGEAFLKADQQLRPLVEAQRHAQALAEEAHPGGKRSVADSLLAQAEKADRAGLPQNWGPIRSQIAQMGSPRRPELFYAAVKDTAQIDRYLSLSALREHLPARFKFAKFLWGIPDPNVKGLLPLYAVKSNRKDLAPLSGDVIVNAQQEFNPRTGRPIVTMQMDSKGADIWEKMTGEAYQNATAIAIVLDDVVYSAPGVTSGAISGGRSEISGNFSVAEAQDLATKLNAGKLPAPARIIQAEIVGPSLGHESINAGLKSFVIALIVVFLYMIFYYALAGFFADLALLANLLFIFGVLASLHAVLTLPGIAGIVLTIGMSVDANVLIYERVKEELHRGEELKQSIHEGYEHALSSILDANITTLLTGIVLYIFGTGPIRGFATTLIIGILTSLFSAIFLSRLLIEGKLKRDKGVSFYTRITENWLRNVNVDFLGKRKISYIASLALVVISLISLFTRGLDFGVDFLGGRTYTVRFDKPVSTRAVADSLAAQFIDADGNPVHPEVKTFGGDEQVKITTKYKIDQSGTQIDDEIIAKLYRGLKPYLPKAYTLAQFKTLDSQSQYGIMESIKVGPTIADDIQKEALWALSFSLAIVFLYILLRFTKWQFSAGAVLAVFHDSLIVLGVFSLLHGYVPFSLEIDQAFIAAILTVIGYSLNDTVIVFDRIREYFKVRVKQCFGDQINAAINSTLSRTLNTSLTTFFVLLVIFLFGGENIQGFMFAIMVGIAVGTYSSVFIATPIMYDFGKVRREDKSISPRSVHPSAHRKGGTAG